MPDSESSPPGTASAVATAAVSTPIVKTPPTAELNFGFSSALLLLTRMSLQVLAQAKHEATHGDARFAVLLAYAACEWATEEALGNLMRLRGAGAIVEPVLGMFGSTRNLTNNSVLELFEALTNTRPTQETWWQGWKASCKLRHPIAHKGKPATSQQALESVQSAEQYVQYLTDVVAQTPPV